MGTKVEQKETAETHCLMVEEDISSATTIAALKPLVECLRKAIQELDERLKNLEAK